MPISRLIVDTLLMGLMLLGVGGVSGQSYPDKPVRMLASEPGGGNDFVARVLAQALSGSLGQQVIVDNRNTLIAVETAAKASPDGYTLLVVGSSFWIAPLLRKLSYDPVKDFAPVTLTDTSPNILFVNSSLPVKTVKDLIALAKAKPGEINYGTSSFGGSPHLAAELFKTMAGVNMVQIMYKGTGPAINALIGGQVQLMFGVSASGMPHVKSGRLRALAVTSAKPSALVPELPTIAASGLPGYESEQTHSIFAPARTPRSVIDRLNKEIRAVINGADVKERFLNGGIESVGSSPEQLSAQMKSEMATIGKLIKDAGIKAD